MPLTFARVGSLVIVGVIALLAQIIVAPNIRIVGAVPDLVLVTVIIQALRLPQTPATVFGFASGLFFDLVSSGPFGLMTLILTLLSLVVSALTKGTFTEHWIMELLFVILATLFGELLYGVALALVNPDLDFFGSLLSIVLPTTLYDAVFGSVVLLIVHLLKGHSDYASGGSSSGRLSGPGGPGGSFSRTSRSNLSGRRSRRLGKPSGRSDRLPGRPINRKLR